MSITDRARWIDARASNNAFGEDPANQSQQLHAWHYIIHAFGEDPNVRIGEVSQR